jgi:hypothetical protein
MNENNKVVEYTTASIRAVAASFPVIASVAAGWGEYKNIKQAEHIQDIITEFAKRIFVIESSLDKDFLNSDEMKKLIEQAVAKGKDEIMQEKRYLYSEFLKNAATQRLSFDKEKDMVLETISKVSALHISILTLVASSLVVSGSKDDVLLGSDYDHGVEDKPVFKYHYEKGLVDLVLDITKTDVNEDNVNNIEASLDYMLSIGLLELHSHRGWTQIGNKQGIRAFRPTKLGLKILDYVGRSIDNMDNMIF